MINKPQHGKPEVLVLAFANQANAHLLTSILSSHYKVFNITNKELPQFNFAIDLCIFDGLSLNAAKEWIREQKSKNLPVFFPVLLVTSLHDLNLSSNQDYDEILRVPINPRELVARIMSLIRVRNLSLQNYKLYQQSIKRNMLLRQQKKTREIFVTTLAHDLRSPLSVAKVYTHLIEKKQNKKIPDTYISSLKKTLNRMNEMVQNLLDANHINAGETLRIKRIECDLNEVLKQIVQDFAVLNEDRFNLLIQAEGKGFWDPHVIRRAIENLCDNALKYGASNSIITVGTKCIKNHLHLYVHNEGSSLTSAELKQIFKLFNRAESARKENQSGWGIGLVLVKGAAKSHNGRVTVKSSSEKGTTFTIHLPIKC